MNKKITKIVNLNTEEYDVYIGRGSKWGSPFTSIKNKKTLAIEVVNSKEESLQKYREYILNNEELMASLHELEGKILGCFCIQKNDPFPFPYICHGQILIELISKKNKLNLLKNKF